MQLAYFAARLVLVASTAAAQHSHPPEDGALHEKFYSTWYMPDNPNVSCCNNADCNPTEIEYVGSNIYARGGLVTMVMMFVVGRLSGENRRIRPQPVALRPLLTGAEFDLNKQEDLRSK